MRRAGINIFGTSFLDLLSGALGAVIILFIIVPKMSQADADLIHKAQEIEKLALDIDQIVERIENSVPKDVLQSIDEELDEFRQDVADLQVRINQLEDDIASVQSRNAALEATVAEQQTELERLREQLGAAKAKLKEKEDAERTANTVEKTLGVFAQFGILCRWEELDVDVDMGVQKFGQDAEHCWRMYPSKPWGILGEDVRERVDDDKERFELFYVPRIYPEEYTLWVNIYEGSQSFRANVKVVMIFHPGKPDEQRHEIGPVALSGTGTRCVVTFRLTDYGFEMLPHREPQWGEGRVVK